MWRSTVLLTVFLGAAVLEVAARAYYDAVVVEARGADDDDDYSVAFGDQVYDQTFNANTDCFLSKEPGPCRGLFRAHYYSATTGSCEEFIYSGCGGNKNRFKTRDECEKKCRGVAIKRKGSLRPDGDDCIPPGESCEAKGCRTAPKAQWDQQKACKSCICSPVTPIAQAACRQTPAARGHCRALLPRWSYDQHSKSCREFQFGGCDGNKNNFPSLQACLRICSGV